MEKLITAFQRFATYEAKGNSPLYKYWCEHIITNELLLQLMKHIPLTQPKPNLFFASVQYLAMQKETPLKHVFDHPFKVDFAESFQLLIQFCTQYEDELIHLFQTKLVQTNEVQRASYLYPIFSEIAQKVNKPLTLIEIGTSAGLLLNLDGYRYEISQSPAISYGDENSHLTLHAKNLGKPLPLLKKPSIKQRIGIDLNIINLEDEEQYLWLKSLIWPELIHRKENLEKARTIHAYYPKFLYTGDFRKILLSIFEKQDLKDSQVIIFHTHVANQFTVQLKEKLLTTLKQLSNLHSIYHIYNNLYDSDLHVDFIEQEMMLSMKTLKNTDGHGNAFYWC